MAINNRRTDSLEELGWPDVNYAQNDRGFLSGTAQNDVPLSIPRFKFTWLAEFQLNSRVVENPTTNISEFINNGKIYVHLISIDHPKPQINTERLRSYNKWILVPTRVDFPAANMTFHDDSTSVVQALWKEHLNFYSHLGQVGQEIFSQGVNTNLSGAKASGSYQEDDSTLTGADIRANIGTRPSLGMRLKANDMRHFFENIVIYDLGTDPDGINIYWYNKPIITAWDHDPLDKEDRTGNVRVSANFEYESYYFTHGQNRGRISQYIERILDRAPPPSEPRKSGIARDIDQSPISFPKQLATTSPQAGFAGDDLRTVLPSSASIPEQLAGVNGLATQARETVEVLRQQGQDVAGNIQEAARKAGVTNRPTSEPAAPNQIRPEIPANLFAKQRDLGQTRDLIEEVSNIFVQPGTPDASRKEQQLAALNQRARDLTDAIQRQQSVRAAQNTDTEAERSALANTQAATSGTVPPQSGVIDNPTNSSAITQRNDQITAAEARIGVLDTQIAANQQAQNALRQNAVSSTDARFVNARAEQIELREAKAAEERQLAALKLGEIGS